VDFHHLLFAGLFRRTVFMTFSSVSLRAAAVRRAEE
jgi:hypothetical protein